MCCWHVVREPVIKTIVFCEHLNNPGHPIFFCRLYFPAHVHTSDAAASQLAKCCPCAHAMFLTLLCHDSASVVICALAMPAHVVSRARIGSGVTQIGLPSLLCLCSSGRKKCNSLSHPHLSLPIGSTTALRSVPFPAGVHILATVVNLFRSTFLRNS